MIDRFLKQGVMEGLQQWTPEAGSPSGAVIGPLLGNIYLNPLDHAVTERGFQIVRYADDLILLCRAGAEAKQALALVGAWIENLDLTLRWEKTRIVDSKSAGFEFLGYHFVPGHRWPQKSVKTLKVAVKTNRPHGGQAAAPGS